MQRGNKKFGVVLVQLNVTKDRDVNFTNVTRLVKTAVTKHNPKLVVLPEYFNIMFHGRQDYDDYAEYIPKGETSHFLSSLAKEHKIYLVGGSFIELDDQIKHHFYNTTTVWGPTGELIAKHRKIHLADMEMDRDFRVRESDFFKRGHELTTFDLEGIKVGLGIGYDLHFHEMAAMYRKNGVDLLIYPSAYPVRLGNLHWDQLTRSRAIDNQVFVIGVSAARDDNDEFVTFGHSIVVDGHGRVLARGGDKEEVIYTDMDFTDLDKYRHQIPLMNHRRTDLYDTIFKH